MPDRTQPCIALTRNGDPCGQPARFHIGEGSGADGDHPGQPMCHNHTKQLLWWFGRQAGNHPAAHALQEERRLHTKTEQAAKWEAPGDVYFGRIGNRVKIGYSAHTAKRRRTLELMNGTEFDEFVTMPGDVDLERWFHNELQEHRTVGEWFEHAPAVQEAMLWVKKQGS